MTIPLLEQCLFSIILMLMLFCEHVPNLAVLRLLLHNNCQHNWHFRILNFYHFALTFFINFLKENNNLNNINWLIKNLKTLWYFFTDRVQLSNRATTRKQFIFTTQSSWVPITHLIEKAELILGSLCEFEPMGDFGTFNFVVLIL